MSIQSLILIDISCICMVVCGWKGCEDSKWPWKNGSSKFTWRWRFWYYCKTPK